MSLNYSQDYNKILIKNNKFQRYSEVDLFSTTGRLGQKHYFVYSVILPLLLFWTIASLADLVSYLPIANTFLFGMFMGIAFLATAYLLVRLTIQRCHDFNKCAWLATLAVIPFANIIFALISGTNGLNQYGEIPKPAGIFIKILFLAVILALLSFTVFMLFQLINNGFFSHLMLRFSAF